MLSDLDISCEFYNCILGALGRFRGLGIPSKMSKLHTPQSILALTSFIYWGYLKTKFYKV